MNTKNDNVQETLDLQVEETGNIKKEVKKKAVKKSAKEAGKTVAKSTEKESKDSAKKKTTAKKPVAKVATAKREKAEKADSVDKKAKAATVKQEEVKSKTTKPKTAVKKTTAKKPVAKKVDEAEKATTTQKQKSDRKSVKDVAVETVEQSEIKNSTDIVKEPIVEDIKRHKLFFVSDMDEEAVYLHEMSLQGYHFLTKKGMQYSFRQGEPKNYFYHLGYYEKDKRDGERYLDNYTEAGWENIYHEKAEFDGVWNYFRIEMPIGESEPNIFSDRVSRLALYKRLLSSWRTLLAVDIICFFFTLFVYIFLTNHPMNMTNVYRTLCGFLDLIIILIFIVYFRAYLKISRKQRELENI